MKKSTIKTDLEGFNSCPPRTSLAASLRETIPAYEVVDIITPYFQNSEDTLVLLVRDIESALAVGQFATIWVVDEFNFVQLQDKSGWVVRLWWD